MPVAFWFALTVAGLLLDAGASGAEEQGLGAPVEVAEVLAGDRLALADGRTVRLAGVRLPPGNGPLVLELRGQAQATLERLADRKVRLALTPAPLDRYGDLVAQVEGADGGWLQGALLEQGLAQVQTRPGEVARAGAMLALERQARAAGRGLWADPAFAPRRAERVADAVGSFQIVQGRVVRVAPTDHFVYLNFGADWWRDFTLRVARADLRDRFEGSTIDLMALAGRRIEVRGFVLNAGGPLIELSHPEQIEILP